MYDWDIETSASTHFFAILRNTQDSFMIYPNKSKQHQMAIPYFTMRRFILAPEKFHETRQLAVQDQSSWAQDAWDKNPGRGNIPPTISQDIPRRSSTKYNRYAKIRLEWPFSLKTPLQIQTLKSRHLVFHASCREIMVQWPDGSWDFADSIGFPSPNSWNWSPFYASSTPGVLVIFQPKILGCCQILRCTTTLSKSHHIMLNIFVRDSELSFHLFPTKRFSPGLFQPKLIFLVKSPTRLKWTKTPITLGNAISQFHPRNDDSHSMFEGIVPWSCRDCAWMSKASHWTLP